SSRFPLLNEEGSLMVRLLERLRCDRNRGVDTSRSLAEGAACLGRLTPPARKITRRRSCRLQLEPLEDRLTPSLSLKFIPIAHVAVNPQPLPPGNNHVPAVYLQEMPPVTSPVPGVSTQHDHIVGFLSKQITLPASTAGTPSQTWNLEASCNLILNATTTVTQADPFSGQEGVTASFGLAGTIAATLQLQG